MDMGAPENLRRIWRQNTTPVIVRKGRGHRLHVKLPNPSSDMEQQRQARQFLQKVKPNGRLPEWLVRYNGWGLPQSWFNALVELLLNRFGSLYVIQPYRAQEKCAPMCMTAVGHECECSCMGANHGAGGPGSGWFVVSDTFATRWGNEELACRLMIRRAN